MQKRRFILFGFDGANPEMVEKYLPDLPNFQRLIADGAWGPMLSTIPCDTPTNWTALATGATAATSRITGFDLYQPGTSLKGRLRPTGDYDKVRAAEFLWEAADRQGRKTILINYPYSWDSRNMKNGVIIGGNGMGTRSTIHGSGYICTSDRIKDIPRGKEVRLEQDGNELGALFAFGSEQELEWTAIGPRLTGKQVERKAGSAVRIRILPGPKPVLSLEDDGGNQLASLSAGEWSRNAEVSVGDDNGLVRFFLADISDKGKSFQLYHTNIACRSGWARQEGLAEKLFDEVGPFHCGEEGGTSIDRGTMPDEVLAGAYIEALEDTGRTVIEYAEKLAGEIDDWDQIFIQLHCNDGLNHNRLGYLDPNHPLTDVATTALSEKLFKANYQGTDRVVGMLADLAERHDAIMVAVADHSAVPTHTWVDTAKPFQERGLLHFLEDGAWDAGRSKVRHMKNHSIYVNLKGRQPEGIVEQSEYEKVRDETIAALLSLRDPRTGECPISVAARREDLESVGANGESWGDVVYLMRPGYTNQPGSEAAILDDEEMSRSVMDIEKARETGFDFHFGIRGNHHDYLPNAEYPGVCSNKAILLFHGPGVKKGLKIRNARTIDVAPTLAWWTGIEPPAQSEGRILSEVFEE